MEVSSANSSSVANSQRTMRTEQAQQLQQRKSEQQPSETKANPSTAAAPVINTQGQTTGRLLNVTA